MTNQEDC